MNTISNYFNRTTAGIKEIPQNLKLIFDTAKNLGFKKVMKIMYDDLFGNRTLIQWLYLLSLSFILPIGIEFWVNGMIKDPISLFASITGILCVILVAESRASNYFFGLINSIVYLMLSIRTAFYGEVVTMIFFTIMQPIGLYAWIVSAIKNNNKQSTTTFETKRFTLKDWIIYIVGMIIVWFGMGKAYESIGSAHAYRDSITDATNYAGQFAMTQLAPEQWIFWILTNLFSMYLWFGDGFDANATTPANLSIMVMYLMYTINSIVGWIKWNKLVKK